MPTTTVTVTAGTGLHARPAATIAHAARCLDGSVTLSRPGMAPVDAGSALMIMTLGVDRGELVEVRGDDPAAVARIASLVERGPDS